MTDCPYELTTHMGDALPTLQVEYPTILSYTSNCTAQMDILTGIECVPIAPVCSKLLRFAIIARSLVTT